MITAEHYRDALNAIGTEIAAVFDAAIVEAIETRPAHDVIFIEVRPSWPDSDLVLMLARYKGIGWIVERHRSKERDYVTLQGRAQAVSR